MTQDDCFDEQALPRLERMVGPQVLCEVLDLYLESTPQRIAAVRAGLRSNDLGTAARALHDLKSSAGMIGASDVQRLADEMERLARRNDAQAVGERLETLEAAATRIAGRIEQARAQREL